MKKEKEVTYTVYKHENLSNGKSYIGMTSREPKYRWNNGNGYKNQPKIWSDIKESDWNADWEHNIIGKFEDKQEALNIEEMFIWLYDSINEGYNTSAYSSHSCNHTEESKKKISESKIGEKSPMFGKHHSEESKKHISESMTGNHNSPTKPVLQYSKTGEFIAEYQSIREAERQTGCKSESVCRCCKGNHKSAGGFIWQYKNI